MIDKHTKFAHGLPEQVQSEDDWREFCEWMLDAVGMGFHPDSDIVDYVDVDTGQRSFDEDFAKRTVQPLLDRGRDVIAEELLYDIAFDAMLRRYPEIGADYRKQGETPVTAAPLIRRAEIVRVLPQWLNAGEEDWRWIALDDQDPETRRVKIAPLNSGLAIAPTEIVSGDMVEGTGMIIPVEK